MHPILARRRYLGLYLGVFFPAGLLLAELVTRSTGASRTQALVLVAPLVLLHAFSCLASSYLCASLPLDAVRPERLLVVHLVAGVVACGLLLGVGFGWAQLVARAGRFGDSLRIVSASATLIFVFALLFYSLAVTVHYLLLAAAASRAADQRAWELKVLAQEAELKALRAQIDPHFLFNSLNSISSLVSAEPQQARQMCIRLAELLRQSLRLGALVSISLREEMALATSYLEVEQVRFGNRLRFEPSIGPGCDHWRVPPLVLQPLVENAVRHGISQLPEGGTVTIAAERRGGGLHLVVVNACDPEASPSAGEGIGLGNLRRRLAAACGGAATLVVRHEAGRFRVEIFLPAGGPVPTPHPP